MNEEILLLIEQQNERIQQFIQMVMESADEFSDDELEELLMIADQAQTSLNEVILFLQESGNEEIEEPIQVDHEPVPPLNPSIASSNVNSFAYNPDNGQLYVKFNGKTDRDGGPVYQFGGVEPRVFDLFRKGAVPARTDGQNKWGKWWKGKVPSAGASFFTLIKNHYPYSKVA